MLLTAIEYNGDLFPRYKPIIWCCIYSFNFLLYLLPYSNTEIYKYASGSPGVSLRYINIGLYVFLTVISAGLTIY